MGCEEVINRDWQVGQPFAAAIEVDKQREILQAERNEYIAKGFDIERGKKRLELIVQANPAREYDAELELAATNLTIINDTITAIDKQLAELVLDKPE